MKKSFNINQSSPIYIYGAGNLGISAAKKLVKKNYNVVGILDINKSLVDDTLFKVYYPGDEPFIEDACVCICLYNGLQHITTSKKLYKMGNGYRKCIFLPIYLNTRKAKKMIQLYNNFISGNFLSLIDIPYYDELWHLDINDYFLRENGEFVTVLVPPIHIYTVKRKIEEWHPLKDYAPEVLNDIPGFYFDQPIYNTLDFLISGLKNRSDLLSFYNNVLNNGLEFFIDSAPPAIFNKKNYFNLLDGHHRTAFLFSLKIKSIPILVLRSDYESYFNIDAANKLMEYCKTLDHLPFFVTHPAFIYFPINENIVDECFTNLYNNLYIKTSN